MASLRSSSESKSGLCVGEEGEIEGGVGAVEKGGREEGGMTLSNDPAEKRSDGFRVTSFQCLSINQSQKFQKMKC